MKLYFVLFCLVITLFMSYGENNRDILVVSDVWEGTANEDGTGLYFDILREVFENNGYKIIIKNYPYSRAVYITKRGDANIVIGPYTGEVDNVIYPKYHFAVDKVVVLFKKTKINNWQGIDSLRDKTVGWMRGYSYDKYINIPVNYIEVDKRESTLQMLLSDRIDIFIDSYEDLTDLIEKQGVSLSDFELKNLIDLKMYMCFSNNTFGKELSEVWDREIEKLIKNKRLYNLFKSNNLLKEYSF